MSARDEPVAEEIQHGPAHGGARSRQMMCHSERREKLNLQRDFRQRRAERDGEAVRSHPVREGGVDHRNLRRARRRRGEAHRMDDADDVDASATTPSTKHASGLADSVSDP